MKPRFIEVTHVELGTIQVNAAQILYIKPYTGNAKAGAVLIVGNHTTVVEETPAKIMQTVEAAYD